MNPALVLSLQLALATTLILLPPAILLARALAWREFRGRGLIETLVTLPLLLPPTVLGFFLLIALGPQSPLGQGWTALTGRALAFSFDGLLLAALVVNIPFAVQPLQRAFAAIPREAREAAWSCGRSRWWTLWRVELPLAWTGLITALLLTFVQTLGEFGVMLMVGGNLDGATRTLSIALYDSARGDDDAGALRTALLLLAISFSAALCLHAVKAKAARHG